MAPLLLIFIFLALLYLLTLALRRRSRKLPPGPHGWPLFGALPAFRRATASSASFTVWLLTLRTYGELTTIRLGSATWISLNSTRVVSALIDRRGSITCERPYYPIASGLVSQHKRTVLRQTAAWKEGRRVMQRLLLSSSDLAQYGAWAELESTALLAAYLQRPERWFAHHTRYTLSVVYRIVFGQRVRRRTREVEAFVFAAAEFVASIHASAVDFFPWVAKVFPEYMWRGGWKDMGERHRRIYQAWWRLVKEAVEGGTAPQSWTRDVLLAKETGYTGSDEDAMYLSTSVVGAGADNPRKVLNTFVMAALLYPDVLMRARAAVDGVCGKGADMRLPKIEDMESMPYVCAVLKEVMRWRPSVPLIPPHQLTQDLEFEGYFFPKGTIFVINAIALGQECEHPDEFRPERWIDDDVCNVSQGHWSFGGGRRICVGFRVAQQLLFIALARLIYCFDYEAAGPLDDRTLNHQKSGEPFPVKVKVRSKEYEALILNEARQSGVLEDAKLDF
ncbi:cytochrome P450 [Halenospora varia]|nr:cytochrome P450 [Halenospora varia]